MTLVLEWRGLLFGLLTATSLASITGIVQRVVKQLIPKPQDYDRRRPHIDSRDVLSELIVSCEGVPTLISGPYVLPSVQGRANPPPTSYRVRIIALFVFAFIITMTMETGAILSTGGNTEVLHVPDVSEYSMVMRHVVHGGASLPSLDNITFNDVRCVENDHIAFNESHFFDYRQDACLTVNRKKPDDMQLSNWTLSTEENQIERLRLFVGRIEFTELSTLPGKHRRNVGIEKHTWAQVTVRILREITRHPGTLKRVLDADSARLIYRSVHNEISRCAVKEALDTPLDRDIHGRPAYLANFTCNPPITLGAVVAAMERGIFAGIGRYHYEAEPAPRFKLQLDRQLIDREMNFEVGMTISESFEDGWFVALAVITSLGIFCFGLERCWASYTYPNVAVLSIMNDINRSFSRSRSISPGPAGDTRNGSNRALVAQARVVDNDISARSAGGERTRLRFGYADVGESESFDLRNVPNLPSNNFTFNFRRSGPRPESYYPEDDNVDNAQSFHHGSPGRGKVLK